MKSKWVALALAVLMTISIASVAAADYIIESSDTDKLTREALAGYTASQLGYIRAEIAARHGYVFSNENYIHYFSAKDWYVPDASFRIDQLSGVELYNIELIRRVEESLVDLPEYAESEFVHSSFFISDSDSRLLTKSDLEGYTLGELGFIRNEILARHGYPFKTEKYRDYFDSCSWYERDEHFDSGRLNSIEKKNVALIQKIEKALS